ncbi:MAG: NAD(P)-dependent oxidoreductase [Magnetococcales bacterium]|nr:NAD(P)-dependent oxidoreductase [Magnetococcales bacterium]MBF0321340.1 NAD(P)-dependent oxidoreductase [Magnetococcales bacterium]
MKTILITGGFGFLGTHLTELLTQDQEDRVHVVDDLSTSPLSLEYYFSKIGNRPNLTWDILTIQNFFARGVKTKFDEVYHLASPVGPAGVLKFSGEMVRQVVTDSYLVMDYCVQNAAKFLNVSTSEVYGGGQGGYCPETTPKIVPPVTTVRLEYAIAKLAAETSIINTCRVKDLHAVIVRPFNVAGPHQSPRGGFVLPRFLRQAHAGEPLTVFNEGNAVRAITHVQDMVDGIVRALRFGRSGEAYNIGNPANKVSVLDLARKVLEVTRSPSAIIKVDPKTIHGPLFEEANDKFPDNEKAKKELGWFPKFTLEEVIKDAYQDFLEQLEKKATLDPVT